MKALLRQLGRAFGAMSFANVGDNLGDFQRRLAAGSDGETESSDLLNSAVGDETIPMQTRRPMLAEGNACQKIPLFELPRKGQPV